MFGQYQGIRFRDVNPGTSMGSTSDVRGQNTQRGAFVHSLRVVHDEEKLVYFGAQTTVVPCKAIREQV